MFKWNAVLLCVVNVIFTFAGTICNSVVILSLWNSQLRTKICYFMIFILASFDLAVVAVIHPSIIFRIISCWMTVDVIEHWIKYIYILFDFSLTALLTMTLERYLALVYPFFHKQLVTKSRLVTAFVLFQLPFNMLCIIGLAKGNRDKTVLTISYIVYGIFLLIICVMNFQLFSVARKLRKHAVVTLGHLNGTDYEPRNNSESKMFKLTFSTLRKVSTCLLAVVCLSICYVPWIVHYGIKESNGLTSEQNMNEYILELWLVTLSALNSSLNCLIFFYKNSVLRRHGKNYFETCFLQKIAA